MRPADKNTINVGSMIDSKELKSVEPGDDFQINFWNRDVKIDCAFMYIQFIFFLKKEMDPVNQNSAIIIFLFIQNNIQPTSLSAYSAKFNSYRL